MAALGPLGIGLSIVFGGFVLVLLAELYYVFFWKKYGILNRRVSRIGAEYCSERGDFAHEAALVGSFGGYSESSAEAEFVAKLFPMGPEAIGSDAYDNLYMHGVFRNPSFLFTIKEETKEDMEFEEPVKHKDAGSNNNVSFLSATQPLQSPLSKMSSDSPSPKQQQQQQWQNQHHLSQFPYSIGLIQQPQLFRSMSTRCISHQTLLAPMHQNMLRVSSGSSHSSSSLPSSPAHRSSSSSPSRPTSASVSPSLCSRSSSPKQQSFNRSGSNSSSPNQQAFIRSGSSSPELFSVSNPIYEFDSNEFLCNVKCNESSASSQQDGASGSHRFNSHDSYSLEIETPFGTPISSPSLLTPSETPPGTPPLTPMKAPTDPSAFLKKMDHHRSGISSTFSSSEFYPSFLSSKCSSPSSESYHKNPSFCQFERPPRSPPLVAATPHLDRQQTLMERRAFASLFNQPALQTLPRESPCLNGQPPIPRFCYRTPKPCSNSSSNAGSPSTPFSTAPSTPYFTSHIQCPATDPQRLTTLQCAVEESYCKVSM